MGEASSLNLRSLDVLRGVLALEVLLGHARSLLWMPWWKWSQMPHSKLGMLCGYASGILKFGSDAVMVFFVLSGFFIHLRLSADWTQGKPHPLDVGNFLKRRARRILPPYYAALLLTVLLDVVGAGLFHTLYDGRTVDPMMNEKRQMGGFHTASVIPALLAMPNLLGIRFGTNGALWSVGMEVLYYLLYPAFAWLWIRSRSVAYCIGLAISLLPFFVVRPFLFSGALTCYPLWLGGALLADWLSYHGLFQRCWLAFLLGLSVAGVALLLCNMAMVQAHSLLLLGSRLVMGVSAVLSVAHLREGFCDKQRVLGWLEFIGARSYSVYIFHMPVLFLLSGWAFERWGERPADGWLALAGSLIALVAGLAGWFLVERHFMPKRVNLAGINT
jgi:peptidoglycan/LPS O-acetylase OafA/YrhL